MHNRTVIVVWEGVDGAGKTTLLKRTSEILREKGFTVMVYKTPSETPSGVFAKRYGNRAGVDHLTRMLLFLANTSDDSIVMRREIEENDPHYYFIDRYYVCSIVYGLALSKARGEEVGDDDLVQLLDFLERAGSRVFLKPDLYVVVDVSEEVRRRRVEAKEGQGGIEIEIERDAEIQELVREFYRVFQEVRRDQVVWIDNVEGSLDDNAHRVARRLLEIRPSEEYL